MQLRLIVVLLSIATQYASVESANWKLHLKTNSPVIRGANLTIEGVLYDGDHEAKVDSYIVSLRVYPVVVDDMSLNIQEPHFNFTIESKNLREGRYAALVEVSKEYLYVLPIKIAEKKISLRLTNTLNGNLTLSQNGTNRDSVFVSNATPLNHSITLSPSDMVLVEKAAYVRTFWFINCTYIDQTDNFSFVYPYLKEEEHYQLEALVVASNEPLPEPTTTPAPTTTSTTPSTTTSTTPSTTTTSSTTPSTTTSSTTPSTTTTKKPSKSKRDTTDDGRHFPTSVAHLLNLTHHELRNQAAHQSALFETLQPRRLDQPYVCFNRSNVPPDPTKMYGYFAREIVVKAPLHNATIDGAQWVHHGDMTQLDFSCVGSPPYRGCYRQMIGPHNTTGAESCDYWTTFDRCYIHFLRYFNGLDKRTVLFIMSNDVSKVVTQIGVQIYEVQARSPLSVIVVPIAFVLIATIMIVFGVAYYIQNRNRIVVEVANFNFGETQSVDMEYKTFRQRIVDSIRDVFVKREAGEAPSMAGDSSLRYGSMT